MLKYFYFSLQRLLFIFMRLTLQQHTFVSTDSYHIIEAAIILSIWILLTLLICSCIQTNFTYIFLFSEREQNRKRRKMTKQRLKGNRKIEQLKKWGSEERKWRECKWGWGLRWIVGWGCCCLSIVSRRV